MQHIVAEVAARYPQQFHLCDVDGPHKFDFIKLLAWELHTKYDARWGLNGKRGSATLSGDALAFRVGPTDRHVEVFDVVGGATGPDPRPGWINVTDYDPKSFGQPGTAVFIVPTQPNIPVPSEPPPSTPPPIKPPVVQCNCNAAIQGVQETLAQMGDRVGHIEQAVIQKLDIVLRELAESKSDLKRGLEIDASVKFLGHIGGTIRSPKD